MPTGRDTRIFFRYISAPQEARRKKKSPAPRREAPESPLSRNEQRTALFVGKVFKLIYCMRAVEGEIAGARPTERGHRRAAAESLSDIGAQRPYVRPL